MPGGELVGLGGRPHLRIRAAQLDKFHNGEPVTAEDVKFSFERYKGASHDLMKDRVAEIETPDAQHVRFHLKEPWPDFLTFYATASGAGWVVPKKYVEKVGPDGFKNAPIGAGPYKFVSFTPGVELVFEAFDQYWRKTPSVKRLVFKVIPDESTRLAALKRGEIDIVYSIRGELADELRHTPGLTLKPVVPQGPWWIYFPEQWDPKSPWHDERVRRAASLAIDRKGINDAITLGYSKLTGSIIPYTFEYYWQPPEPAHDPAAAKKLLAEAGHAGGIDAGEYYVDSSYSNFGEAVLDNLLAVGIRAKLRPLERAAFFEGYSNKKFKTGLIQAASGAFGNAATRLASFAVKGGAYAYGDYPELDALYQQQAVELDHAKRAAILAKMQQILHDKTIYAPLMQLAFINGIGPRTGEFGLRPDPRLCLYRPLRRHHDQAKLIFGTPDPSWPGLSRPSTPSKVEGAHRKKTWVAGTSPATGTALASGDRPVSRGFGSSSPRGGQLSKSGDISARLG